jgi:hypothetical protein
MRRQFSTSAPRRVREESPEYVTGETDGAPKWLTAPNTTPVPNTIIDQWMVSLTLSQLRVILYITRRTYGFGQPDGDTISLDQLMHGITRRDGTRLDHGTGLSERSLLQAIRDLRSMGMIRATTMTAPDGGSLPTRYSLHVSDAPESFAYPDQQNGTVPPENDQEGGPAKLYGGGTSKTVRSQRIVLQEKVEGTSGALPPDPRSDPTFATLIPDRTPSVKTEENSLAAWSDIILGPYAKQLIEPATDTPPALVKEPSGPLASPRENQSQLATPGPDPAKPWLTRKVRSALQSPGAARQARPVPRLRQSTPPTKSGVQNRRAAPPEKTPNKYAAVIDGIRAADVPYTPSARDAGAVKKCGADAEAIAAAYIAAYRREWGGNGVQGNLSVWYICDRINDYTAWVVQGRPKQTNGHAGAPARGGTQQGRPGDRFRMGGQLAPSEYENIKRMKAREQAIKAEILAEIEAEGRERGI